VLERKEDKEMESRLLKYAVEEIRRSFGPIFDCAFWRVKTDIRVNTHTALVLTTQRTQSVPLTKTRPLMCLGHDTCLFDFI
jgi:hypothetical protein